MSLASGRPASAERAAFRAHIWTVLWAEAATNKHEKGPLLGPPSVRVNVAMVSRSVSLDFGSFFLFSYVVQSVPFPHYSVTLRISVKSWPH